MSSKNDKKVKVPKKTVTKKNEVYKKAAPAVDGQVAEYDSINPSMLTVVCYPSAKIDLDGVFKLLKVKTLQLKYNRKGDPIKTGLWSETDPSKALKGEIYSAGLKDLLLGTNLIKSTKLSWCTSCRPYEVLDNEMSENPQKVKKLTMNKVFYQSTIPGTKVKCYKIKFHCSMCKKEYDSANSGCLASFPSQMSINLSLGTHGIHAMVFRKGSVKFAGCKSYNDVITFFDVLFKQYVIPNKLFIMEPDSSRITISIHGVLKNMSFQVPYSIDRLKLVNLLNQSKYADIISNLTYESTGNTSAIVKFKILPEYEYAQYSYDLEGKKTKLRIVTDKNYEGIKPKRSNVHCTFIVFTSSEANPDSSCITLSGNHFASHRTRFNQFVKILMENKDLLEEKFDGNDIEGIKWE